jgi:hypothetical protein
MRRLRPILTLLVVAIVFAALWTGFRPVYDRIPPNWIPWGEVALDEDPTWFAKWQIGRLVRDDAACFAALDRSELEYRRLPDRPMHNGCGVSARTQIVRSHVSYSSGFESPCALAAALYWYEQRLEMLAQEQLGAGLRRIEHFGTYACRNLYGREESRRSAHATAEAIDIAGFRFDDGSSISVLRDWSRDDAKGRFLAAAREEACRFFGIVLSPDYNEAHANHFHLELRSFGLCR